MIDKETVILAAIKLFETKGIKFTMLEVSKCLKTSKRTLYEHFDSKEALVKSTVDYLFEEIEKEHKKILEMALPSNVKLKKILEVYPHSINFDVIKFDKILELNPKLYDYIDKQLSMKWDLTLNIFKECVKEGSITPISPEVFKTIILGIYEQSLKYSNHKQIMAESIEAVFCGLNQGENKG